MVNAGRRQKPLEAVEMDCALWCKIKRFISEAGETRMKASFPSCKLLFPSLRLMLSSSMWSSPNSNFLNCFPGIQSELVTVLDTTQ